MSLMAAACRPTIQPRCREAVIKIDDAPELTFAGDGPGHRQPFTNSRFLAASLQPCVSSN
jgi:hypothetical protein